MVAEELRRLAAGFAPGLGTANACQLGRSALPDGRLGWGVRRPILAASCVTDGLLRPEAPLAGLERVRLAGNPLHVRCSDCRSLSIRIAFTQESSAGDGARAVSAVGVRAARNIPRRGRFGVLRLSIRAERGGSVPGRDSISPESRLRPAIQVPGRQLGWGTVIASALFGLAHAVNPYALFAGQWHPN